MRIINLRGIFGFFLLLLILLAVLLIVLPAFVILAVVAVAFLVIAAIISMPARAFMRMRRKPDGKKANENDEQVIEAKYRIKE